VLSARPTVRAAQVRSKGKDSFSTMTDVQLEVIGGVDTHADTHTAAAVDELGRILGHERFPTTVAGYRALLRWLSQLGPVRSVGVEGTGSYGVGLTRFLRAEGVHVLEVDRPNRKLRRQRGKSDPVDAEAAARAVLAGTARTLSKSRDGQVEAIRAVRAARLSADRPPVHGRTPITHPNRKPRRGRGRGCCSAIPRAARRGPVEQPRMQGL